MASSAGKRTSEKVSDEHSQIERSVDSKEFDETETVDETRRVDKAEESPQETDQLRELFELVKTCRKEIAILTREKEQHKDVAMAAQMAVEIATEGQGQHEALAKGSTYDEVVDHAGMEAEAKTKTNLPSDDSYEELPKFDVAEDVEPAQVVPEEQQEKGVKVNGSLTRSTEMDDKKKGRLKVTAMPVL